MSTKSAKKSDCRLRPPQVVFKMGPDGIAAGAPKHLLGAIFLCEPGRDRADANEYLYSLHTRDFAKKRRHNPPEWMGKSRKLRMNDDSLRTEARNLSLGFRWLESKDLSIITMAEDHLDILRQELSAQGLESGPIGAIQLSLLHCAQWAVWNDKRAELDIGWGPGSSDNSSPNIYVVEKQRRGGFVEYINRSTAQQICEAIPDPAYKIAVRLLFGSGLRPSEPGAILDQDMPRTPALAVLDRLSFSVVGKGAKRRRPELGVDLLEDINRYRLLNRPGRVEKYEQRRGAAPPQLLLNSKNGSPISYFGVYANFNAACDTLNIEACPHWARHAFACDQIVKSAMTRIRALKHAGSSTIRNEDLEAAIDTARLEVMLLLGHEDLSTTDRYLVQVRRALAHAIEPMAGQ